MLQMGHGLSLQLFPLTDLSQFKCITLKQAGVEHVYESLFLEDAGKLHNPNASLRSHFTGQ